MLAEVYEHIDTETGGIFLGHRENNTWYVLESVDPGPNSIFTPNYFEYDDEYVTYRANKLSRLYKCSLNLLGLWHRHPGLLKTFSRTDDETNKTYADMLNGAVSGIVTLGNGFEITMYYVPGTVRYEKIKWEVNDKLIPKDLLSYYSTGYYEDIINEAVGKKNAHNNKDKTELIIQTTNRKTHKIESNNNRKSKEQNRSGSTVFSSIAKKFTERKTDYWDTNDDCVEEQEVLDDEKRDIAYIFDTIEPEIEFLQKLESGGKVRVFYSSQTDLQGNEYMIIEIEDNRQEFKYKHKLKLFVKSNSVMIQNMADGSIQKYNKSVIHLLLGGNS